VLDRAEPLGDALCRGELGRVALTVVDRQAMAFIALAQRPGERGGGVQAAR